MKLFLVFNAFSSVFVLIHDDYNSPAYSVRGVHIHRFCHFVSQKNRKHLVIRIVSSVNMKWCLWICWKGTFVGLSDIWPCVRMFGHVCVNNVHVVWTFPLNRCGWELLKENFMPLISSRGSNIMTKWSVHIDQTCRCLPGRMLFDSIKLKYVPLIPY